MCYINIFIFIKGILVNAMYTAEFIINNPIFLYILNGIISGNDNNNKNITKTIIRYFLLYEGVYFININYKFISEKAFDLFVL